MRVTQCEDTEETGYDVMTAGRMYVDMCGRLFFCGQDGSGVMALSDFFRGFIDFTCCLEMFDESRWAGSGGHFCFHRRSLGIGISSMKCWWDGARMAVFERKSELAGPAFA